MALRVESFFDEPTRTFTYLVSDRASARAAIIDPVLDFDLTSGSTGTISADRVLQSVAEQRMTVDWVLETHAHADHISAAQYIRTQTNARVAIGAGICDVQKVFNPIFNVSSPTDGSQFDQLFSDGDTFQIGGLQARVMHTPGHTPACVTYLMGDCAFVGDTLFMPDYGSARCDFPGGDARTLYRSAQRLFELPDETRLFMCHDYLPKGRSRYENETTVRAEREENIHLRDGVTESEFIQMRTARDATLNMPALLLPAVQVNIQAGRLPRKASNGRRYLTLPLNAFGE